MLRSKSKEILANLQITKISWLRGNAIDGIKLELNDGTCSPNNFGLSDFSNKCVTIAENFEVKHITITKRCYGIRKFST